MLTSNVKVMIGPPLNVSIGRNFDKCTKLLLDHGADLSLVHSVKIPDWVYDYVNEHNETRIIAMT